MPSRKVGTRLARYTFELARKAAAVMSPVQLFSIASQHNRWLSTRQATIAGNIANANTPGYKALDLEPFEMAVEQARLAMAKTNPAHLTPAGGDTSAIAVRNEDPWEITHSGNSVSLEQELIKAGDVNRAYRLNTSIIKAFHRMLLASAKV
jgi:flagellar basal-body rod protein FlgB